MRKRIGRSRGSSAELRTFGVRADERSHPLALDSFDRCSSRLEVDPYTGFLSQTDILGRRSQLYRLFTKRTRRRSPLECSLAFEILRAKRTSEGFVPSSLTGERIAAEWVPVADLESNEGWLFVSIATQGISFAIC